MLCACSSSMLLNSLEVRCLITNSFNRKRSVETWVVNSIDVKLMPRFHFLCHNSLTVNQAIEIPSLHCESRKKRNRLSNTKIWDLKRSTFLSSLYSTDIQHGKFSTQNVVLLLRTLRLSRISWATMSSSRKVVARNRKLLGLWYIYSLIYLVQQHLSWRVYAERSSCLRALRTLVTCIWL